MEFYNKFFDNEFNDIIAIRFDGMIYFGEKAIQVLNEKQEYDQLISCAEFRFMSWFDLGDKWGEYADNAPTLFRLTDNTSFDIRLVKSYLKG